MKFSSSTIAVIFLMNMVSTPARADNLVPSICLALLISAGTCSASSVLTGETADESKASSGATSESKKQRKTLMLQAAPEAAVYDGNLSKLSNLNVAVKTLQLEDQNLSERDAVQQVLSEAVDAR